MKYKVVRLVYSDTAENIEQTLNYWAGFGWRLDRFLKDYNDNWLIILSRQSEEVTE